MIWPPAGLALCVVLSLIAIARSRQPQSSFYAADVYGMSSRTHCRYAALFALGACAFVAAIFVARIPATVLLAGYVLLAVFYLASFARGFEENE